MRNLKIYVYKNTDANTINGETKNESDVVCLENVKKSYFGDNKFMDTTTEEDDEQVSNGDSSTSFSLQECVNEFRSRRIRKSSLFQNRQEIKNRKCTKKTFIDATEQDIINQNLCNKEQERKFKPCQNGFCYCFTSDSGDGAGISVPCVAMRGSKNPLRNRRINNEHHSSHLRKGKNFCTWNERIPQTSKLSKNVQPISNGNGRKNQIVAISRLETSTKDDPLIHIIQELTDNCVISEVRVNKDKINFRPSINTHGRSHPVSFELIPKHISKTSQESSKPSAPTLDQILECKVPQKSENDSQKLNKCKERRYNGGGQLLKKRASQLEFIYEPRISKDPPPKPPRSSFGSDDKYMRLTSSTSSSAKEAEKVVDEFLTKRGFLTNNSFSKTVKEFSELTNVCSENYKRKSYPTSPKRKNNPAKNFVKSHRSCSDVERSVALLSKKDVDYGKNMQSIAESKTEGELWNNWNKTKISHMLNYEKTTKFKTFHSTATQAEPQQRENKEEEVVVEEKPIGWQIPQKVSLDTVDGVEHHNLASNLINKRTPIKKKLIPKLYSSRTQKFFWTEQLRQISPWPSKKNKENIKRKSNSESTPKEFIKFSKKKFLRFVSPKKMNKDSNNVDNQKTQVRNIGVQTSCNDFAYCRSTSDRYENSSSPHSPPGSYHSLLQSSHIQSVFSTQSQDTSPHTNYFDFSRVINSPPKKHSRHSQRKLDFEHKAVENKNEDVIEPAKKGITYRSFSKEFNQDESISKIGHILNNIRTKLEEGDKQAVGAFLKTDLDVERIESGYDCPDSHRLSDNIQPPVREIHLTDPIYSEIEENSVQIIESPNFDNHSGVQHFKDVNYPEVLYAKVNKKPKPVKKLSESQLQVQSQLPLAKIIRDSLKNKKNVTNITPLPSLPEPSGSNSVYFLSPTLLTKPLTHCQSLTNVRVLEHNTIPNQNLYISKSDLSLHRSDIFLENLCRSELIVKGSFLRNKSEKVQNIKTNHSCISMSNPTTNSSRCVDGEQKLQPSDSVLYEVPYENDILFEDIVCSTYDASNLGLNTIAPPSYKNQSTPKKQSFITKGKSSKNEINADVVSMNNSGNTYNNCSNISGDLHDVFSIEKRHQYHIRSFNEANKFETPNILSSRYKSFKNALRKSIKKSKQIIKNERKRLLTSFNLSSPNTLIQQNIYGSTYSDLSSNLNLEELFSLKEGASLCEQIAHTVSVCRKLPDLKRSSEMIEAERLLLFSTLRLENQNASITSTLKNRSFNQLPNIKFFVDEMILPIPTDLDKGIYFNYFYIVTFQYGGVTKSTESAECKNGKAIFRHCGLEFSSSLCFESMQGSKFICHNTIHCKIFMLRLRKISSPLIEPKNQTIIKTKVSSSSMRSTSPSSSLSSVNEVVSRFRLQGSFNVDTSNFNPYEYISQESHCSDQICLRASSLCNIAITSHKKSTKLAWDIQLKGRAEVRFSKTIFKGFLNVRDLVSKHSWNQRWCILDGIFFYIWQDESTLNTNPLFVLDLRDTYKYLNYPLTDVSRELCARPRSFCLELVFRKDCVSSSRSTVFFSAESQEDLCDWLKNINNVLHFIATWFC